MAWHIGAMGDCPLDLEVQLAAEVSAVLAKPEYGCTNSSFVGESVRTDPLHVQGPSPDAVPAPAPEPAPDPVPAVV